MSNILTSKECFDTDTLRIGSAIHVSDDEAETEYTMLIAGTSENTIKGYKLTDKTHQAALVEIQLNDYLKGLWTIELLTKKTKQRIWV